MPESNLRRKKPPLEEPLREIEVLIYSAEDRKNVKHLTRMRTYTELYVKRDVHVAKTKVAEHSGDEGTNPIWNQVVKVKFHETLLENDIIVALNVDIYAHGHLRGKSVGSARILLSDVLKGGGDTGDQFHPVLDGATLETLRQAARVAPPLGPTQGEVLGFAEVVVV